MQKNHSISKRILVIDDDRSILEVMKIMLEEKGFEVLITSEGKEIENIIKSYDPSLIFLDIWMPGIDGKKITKNLKSSPKSQGIPVVIISALNDTRKIAKEIGADGFLAKPFDIQDLWQIAAKYTER